MNAFHVCGVGVNLDLAPLKTFFVLAQQRSYTKAAQKLFVTQSAVSHAIRKLESSVGQPLFERRSSGLVLTDTGLDLLAACEVVFSEIERAQEAIRRKNDSSLGTIRLGATVEFGATVLVRSIAPFLREHPDVQIDLQFGHELPPMLYNGELDLIIDCRNLFDRSLEKTPLFRENYLVVASPAYLEANPLSRVEDLGRVLVLSLDKAALWWGNFLRALPADAVPQFTRVMAINHIRGLVNAACEGIGVALLPEYCIHREREAGALVNVFPDLHLIEDQFFIYQKKSKAGYRRHQLLVEHLKRWQPDEFKGA